MPRWFADSSLSIGRTPLVRLNRVTGGAARLVLFASLFDAKGIAA